MSTIDNRVVKMVFDNAAFEKNAGTSIHTLEKLKQSLNFTGATKGLNEIEAKTKGIKMDALVEGVQTVADKFSYLGIMTKAVLEDLARDVFNVGKRIASALTIDPIKMGFQEYETQINAVQTILANTQDKLKSRGLDEQQRLDLVNEKLDELNLYADKTIYNFTEMTRNIGTFTAAGVELETATNAIQGIANLAAVSGSNSQQASTAMYQLSQALASGTVKLMDWNSVVNAGMGGEVFQKELKDTARAHGIAIDSIISKQGSFRESLSEGWLTSEILTETLEKFTATTEGLTQAQIEQQREMWKSRGYTEEQIDAIFELGKMSTDAATKVKTFTQLIDTLKEALQSGWTQSWEYIIGDFEEAKELWTSISDVLGDYIGKSADARNATLKTWSEVDGGRKAVLEGLQNTFNSLAKVLGIVSSAFKQVFPSITAEQLIDISTRFRDFTKNLELSGKTLQDLRWKLVDIFSGVKNVIDGLINIAATAFDFIKSFVIGFGSGFSQYLTPLIGVFKDITKWFESITESIRPTEEQIGKLINLFSGIGDIVGAVVYVLSSLATNGIKLLFETIGIFLPSGDDFYQTLSNIGDILHLVADKLVEFFDAFKANINLSPIIDALKKLVEQLNKFLHLDEISKKFTDFIKSLKDGGSITKLPLFDVLGKIFDKLKEAANKILPLVKEKFDQVREALANFVKGIGSEAGKFGGLDIIGALGLGAGGFGIAKIAGVFKKIGDTVGDISGLKDSLLEIKDALVDTFGDIQKNLKADALKNIALAIGILAASLFVISLIDTDKLIGSLASVAILMAEVKWMLNNLSGISGKAKNMVGAASLLIGVAVAIGILAVAMRIIGGMKTEDIMEGLIAVTILIGELTIVAKVLSKANGQITKGAGGLILMAAAIALLTIPIKILGGMDLESLGKGLGAVMALILALAGASALTKLGNMGVSAGLGMIAMAGAIIMLVKPVKELGAMNLKSLAKGIGSVAIMLAALTAAARFMPKNMISIGLGLIGMAAGISIIAHSVALLGSMDLDKLVIGLGALALAVAGLVVAANAMVGALPGAAAMLVMSAALIPLAAALKILSSIPFTSLIVALVGLAGSLAIFGLASAILAPLVPAMVAVSGAILVFSVAAALLAAAFSLVALSVSVGGTALLFFIQQLIAMLPFLGKMIGELIISLATTVAQGAPAIGEAFKAIIETILGVVRDEIPLIIETLLSLLTTLLQQLAEYVPQMAEAGVQIILGFLRAIADHIEEIVVAGMDIVIGFMKGVAEKLPEVIDSAFKLIISFINGLADAIRDNHNDLFDAVGNLITAIVEAIGDGIGKVASAGSDLIFGDGGLLDALGGFWNDLYESGKNLIQGFIDGMKSLGGSIWNAACDLANSAANGITGLLQIQSPSRLAYTFGEYFSQGLINGISSLEDDAAKESTNLAKAVVDGLNTSLDNEYDPVLSPVIDLTNVQNGIKSIDGMMSSIPSTYGVNASIDAKNAELSTVMNLLGQANDYTSILNAMRDFRNDMSMYITQLQNMKLVVDSGALVGAITPEIDAALGNRQIFAGRGVY